MRGRAHGEQPVGTLQATLTDRDGEWTAQVAWVIGAARQGSGFASEAAGALVLWLRRRGVVGIAAHIHPGHRASEIVADRAGLRPTVDEVDGERVWRADVSRPDVPPR